MNICLRGKKALVTASGSGIGFSIAQGLAATGAEVIVHSRSEESVNSAIQAITAQTPEAKLNGLAADLSTADGAQYLLQAVSKVDVLVNNFGIFHIQKPFTELTDEDWEHYFQCNVMAAVRLSRALLPGMVDAGWGRIVFISSESALNIPTEMVPYGVSKTALLALSRGIAKTVAGKGVTVNCVLPGPTASNGFKKTTAVIAREKGISLEEAGREYVRTMRPSSILQRPTTTEEVANMVVYVCSKEASGTTGSALRVDGGIVEYIA